MLFFFPLLDDVFCFPGLGGEWEIGTRGRAWFKDEQGSEGLEQDATWIWVVSGGKRD